MTRSTERILIRRPRPDDLPAFLAYRNDPANLRLQPVAPMAPADAAAFLAAQAALPADADDCWIMFAVERRADGRMIGEVGIYLEAARRQAGDIGWSLHRSAWGHGYGAEAAALLLAHAFGEWGLRRVTASMSAENTASVRLCERLGMRLEATSALAQQVGDAWHDVRHYALAADDWRAPSAV